MHKVFVGRSVFSFKSRENARCFARNELVLGAKNVDVEIDGIRQEMVLPPPQKREE